VQSRRLSLIAPTRDLTLASLFAPDLKAWGLDRNQLIDTPKSTYAATVEWAKAIHNQFDHIDGLIWTSRQCDPDRCFIIFGDRASESDFEVRESLTISGHAGLLAELAGYGRRAGIVISV
jgi:hypothetical protein